MRILAISVVAGSDGNVSAVDSIAGAICDFCWYIVVPEIIDRLEIVSTKDFTLTGDFGKWRR